MINPQWLELPISRTNFHGPKAVRAIEVRQYISTVDKCLKQNQEIATKWPKSAVTRNFGKDWQLKNQEDKSCLSWSWHPGLQSAGTSNWATEADILPVIMVLPMPLLLLLKINP